MDRFCVDFLKLHLYKALPGARGPCGAREFLRLHARIGEKRSCTVGFLQKLRESVSCLYIRFNVIMHHTFRKCEGVMMQIAHNDYMAMPRRFPAPDIIFSDIPLPAARCK